MLWIEASVKWLVCWKKNMIKPLIVFCWVFLFFKKRQKTFLINCNIVLAVHANAVTKKNPRLIPCWRRLHEQPEKQTRNIKTANAIMIIKILINTKDLQTHEEKKKSISCTFNMDMAGGREGGGHTNQHIITAPYWRAAAPTIPRNPLNSKWWFLPFKEIRCIDLENGLTFNSFNNVTRREALEEKFK